MNIFTASDLKQLLSVAHQPCISLYMPSHVKGLQVRQDPIRFKNLVRKAEKTLLAAGVTSNSVESLLKPCHRLIDDKQFWQNQRLGLAVFVTAGFFKFYRSTIQFKEFISVTDRFHTKPIIAVLNGNRRFFILSLSQKKIRLFEANSQNITEIEIEVPAGGLSISARAKNSAKELQMVTVRSRGSGKADVVRFSTGGTETDTKKILRKYFQAIDKSVHKALGDGRAPLLLAAVDYLVPLYRDVNNYPNLLESSISGNPDNLSSEDLHKKSLALVKSAFSGTLKAAIDKYTGLESVSSKHASQDLKEILGASFYGRVDTLFAAVGAQVWGSFDLQSNTMAIGQKPRIGYVDLLDLASAYTLINGGTVYALDPKKMPDRNPIAAIYRY